MDSTDGLAGLWLPPTNASESRVLSLATGAKRRRMSSAGISDVTGDISVVESQLDNRDVCQAVPDSVDTTASNDEKQIAPLKRRPGRPRKIMAGPSPGVLGVQTSSPLTKPKSSTSALIIGGSILYGGFGPAERSASLPSAPNLEIPIKRRRGRPRKDEQRYTLSSPGRTVDPRAHTDLTFPLPSTSAEVTNLEVPIQRKRGRPRKDEQRQTLSAPNLNLMADPLQSTLALAKRKRGRPRKDEQRPAVTRPAHILLSSTQFSASGPSSTAQPPKEKKRVSVAPSRYEVFSVLAAPDRRKRKRDQAGLDETLTLLHPVAGQPSASGRESVPPPTTAPSNVSIAPAGPPSSESISSFFNNFLGRNTGAKSVAAPEPNIALSTADKSVEQSPRPEETGLQFQTHVQTPPDELLPLPPTPVEAEPLSHPLQERFPLVLGPEANLPSDPSQRLSRLEMRYHRLSDMYVQKDIALADKEEIIGKHDMAIAEKNRRIEERDIEIEEKDEMIDRREKEIEEKEVTIEVMKEEIGTLRKRVEELEGIVRSREHKTMMGL